MSDRELVKQCNDLARKFYSMHGCTVPADYCFDEAQHPQERGMWNMAVAAYMHINGDDVEDALASLESDEDDDEDDDS